MTHAEITAAVRQSLQLCPPKPQSAHIAQR